MAKAIALAVAARVPARSELLRMAVVHGCALALICAGRVWPVFG